MRDITVDSVNVITLRETVDLVALDAIEASAAVRGVAVALAYIASWRGPDFDGVPITASAIEHIDPSHPLYLLLETTIYELGSAQRAQQEGRLALAA